MTTPIDNTELQDIPDIPERRMGEVDVLARTVYGEARGEKLPGKEAVASVILNRVKTAKARGGYWWGNSIAEVCKKPWQFSCWNENDPNRDKIEAVDESNRIFKVCKRIAMRAVAGILDDRTKGSTHYHTKAVHPPWAWRKTPTVEIGRHLFYANVE